LGSACPTGERIASRPAHLRQVGLAAGDEALIAVLPDVRAVVIATWI
jgi:hypothetical protein